MKKSERLHLVLPSWLKTALKQAADAKGITMSEYIKDVLKDSLKKEKGENMGSD